MFWCGTEEREGAEVGHREKGAQEEEEEINGVLQYMLRSLNFILRAMGNQSNI